VTASAGLGFEGIVSSRRLISWTINIICRATSLFRFWSLAKSICASSAVSVPTWQNVQPTPSPKAMFRI